MIVMMNNRQLAEAFTMIADLSEIKGENMYKTLAYRKAADSLLNLGREASEYWKEGKLQEIPGVGKAIAEKIDELLSTGKLGFLEKLKKEVPPGLVEWLPIPGLGPKRAAMIWKALNITTFAELEAAAREGKGD
jgi:DNA polymerase (family 10)